MIVGDPSEWIDQFRSLDTRLLERVAAVWPDCLRVLPTQPEEDQITLNLVDRLMKDQEVRRLVHWIEFHFEPIGYLPSGAAFSKGQIDVAVLLNQDRDKYLAYECKRLNVLNSSGVRSSLATRYVKEGVIRFITEQYAETLPVGSMLAYVMDGDSAFAKSKVHAALTSQGAAIKLSGGPSDNPPVGLLGCFATQHSRKSANTIEIRHALLPFPSIKNTGDDSTQ